MAEQQLSRKLAAIFYADVAGYSRLTGEDEEGTHRVLRQYLDYISATIPRYTGRIVHYAGDAVLADFSSVLDALSCAQAIQVNLAGRNLEISNSRKLEFRIGVNLGEVIVDREEIYGDGVNIAARLETLARPGGICVSEAVRSAVGNKLPIDFEFLGARQVKNIAEPVRAYHASLKPGAELPNPVNRPLAESGGDSRTHSQKPLLPAMIVLMLAIALAVFWQASREQSPQVGVEAESPLRLPDKPSIAVLPFANMSEDPGQDYFADGIAEDLITDLSKLAGLFVISRNSSFSYRGDDQDIRRIGTELGVRYILEGSVRRSGDQVRINAQLIDATTGGHLWADRYDGLLDDIFGLQDQVTGKIVTYLAIKLTGAEQERLAYQYTDDARAYDVFLEGWQHYQRQTPEDFQIAVTKFKRAIELDPAYSHARAALAATYWETWKRFWHLKLDSTSGSHKPRVLAEQYLIEAMKNPSSLAYQVASAMLLHQQQYQPAIGEAQKAIELDPNDADSYVVLANALVLSGEAREAIEWIERAMRLNPHYPAHYLYQLGLARFALGDFSAAAVSLEKAIALNPDDRWASRLLIATYGSLERNQDATKVIEMAQQRDDRGWLNSWDPLTITTSAFWLPFRQPEDADRLADGLRKAGVPD